MAPVHAGMKRRHFLKALGTAAVALAAASLPTPPPPPIDVSFDLSAFGASMDVADFKARYVVPAAEHLALQVDRDALQYVTRIDVLYGWAAVRPNYAIRVAS